MSCIYLFFESLCYIRFEMCAEVLVDLVVGPVFGIGDCLVDRNVLKRITEAVGWHVARFRLYGKCGGRWWQYRLLFFLPFSLLWRWRVRLLSNWNFF